MRMSESICQQIMNNKFYFLLIYIEFQFFLEHFSRNENQSDILSTNHGLQRALLSIIFSTESGATSNFVSGLPVGI